MWDTIVEAISVAEGATLRLVGFPRSVSGGCINDCRVLKVEDASGCHRQYFAKVNHESFADSFSAEADGLDALRRPHAPRVPRPVWRGIAGSSAVFVLEYIAMGSADRGSEQALGRRLAALHRTVAADGRFGWWRDNAIGATPQLNTPTDDWLEFFREHRLRFQFDLAARNGSALRDGNLFLQHAVHAILANHQPAPSLLHGDLWGGNVGCDADGKSVIFDPAVYHGDRETDFAFTRMFGGFGSAFYRSYEEAWPLPAGHALRAELYNLYHVVNHLNLFGGGYQAQAESTMARLLRAI